MELVIKSLILIKNFPHDDFGSGYYTRKQIWEF
jgi:hypothetical protein